jgi:hypothetical protein
MRTRKNRFISREILILPLTFLPLFDDIPNLHCRRSAFLESAGMGIDATSDLALEVQELAWAIVDEQATDRQVRRLEELLLDNADARQIYISCMQMHADLHHLLNGNRPLPIPVQKAVESQQRKGVENAGPSKNARKTAAPLPIFTGPIIVDQNIPVF